MEALDVERSPGVTRKRRADQGVMERRVGSLKWEGGLFRKTGIPFPAIGDEAGHPEPRPYELRCDGPDELVRPLPSGTSGPRT